MARLVFASCDESDAIRITNSIGPKCLGVAEISVPNPSPACGGFPADPVLDPSFGTTFLVAAGNINIDATTSIDTYQCVADVPAMPWTFLTGLGGLLLCLGAWMMSRRTAGGAGPGATA